ncbi:MAG TPA: permease [Gaiellaceae bacterium]|nr:permease [Gaiellaceae bacterium]
METHVVPAAPARRSTRAGALGLVLFAAIFAAALSWAKWTPYLHKLQGIRATRAWPGHDLLAKAGAAHSAPSLHGAWAFTWAYAGAVWPALVAALLIGAALEALVPRRWLLRVVDRRSCLGGSVAGGLLALPSLMCTCCTAPVAASLRRTGASTSATLAYWLGNPVLNPAVLAFLALVAPWQWVATRAIAGVVLVFAATAVVARFLGDGRTPRPREVVEELPRRVPVRFGAALARLSVTLLPEYAVVVFLVGLFRGWLFPFDGGAAHWGVATGVQGALLISLPAISVVSAAMVVRTLSVRVTLAAAAAVVAVSVGAGILLTVL